MQRATRRRKVLLALEWLDYEINLGIAQYARQAGWIVDDVMSHTGRTPLLTWEGDGVIALLRNRSGTVVNYVTSLGLPVVDMVNELPEVRVPRVLADNYGIGRAAAEHLLSCGLEHLAFYNLWNSCVENERMAGFRDTALKAGRQFYPIELFNRPSHEADREANQWLSEQLLKLPKPLGVMGQHDREAMFVVQACEIAGLAVPEEVAVVGSDNDPLCCELGSVPLSSVDNRRRDQGFQAAALLDRLMSGQKPPKEPVRVPTGPVIVRHSSEVMAVSDPELSKALQYIAQHYRESIDVEDVVEHTGTTRRRLYLLFEQHLGRPIRSEILRRRLDLARRLLVTTSDKLYSIAIACGFLDAQHLTRVFTRETGQPPSVYRQQQKGTNRHHAEE